MIRAPIDDALAPGVRFVDPSIDLQGIADFEANVHKVRAGLRGATYSRTSGVDSQHGFHRYHWAIHQGEELVLAGFDFTEIDQDNRVVGAIGFFGPVPEK
ncbi:hypothetical protein [Congregibacter sp.]|uniref:hypothetical protein n=1 Tax=Congregibacter sp. TaxID=2744308 RepID=UPI0039E710CC